MVKEKINNKNMITKEILFRGLYDGNWVYGTYHYSADNKHHYILAREKLLVHDGGYMALHDKEVWQVVPESVGQYTGVKDKKGRKIFEGDIVETKHCGEDTGVYSIEYVSDDYSNGFCLITKDKYNHCTLTSGEVTILNIEVIGNIHEAQKSL